MTIPKADKTKNQRVTRFLRFVEERENIRLLKDVDHAKPPWTKDPILQTYHFCNVKRVDDRVTRWIGSWLTKFPRKNRWFLCAVARWFNEPETLDKVRQFVDPWMPINMVNRCKVIAKESNVFRDSYIINGGRPGVLKYEAVINEVLTPLWKKPPLIFKDNIEASWLSLKKYHGMGSFMAGQIVADWQTFRVIDGKDVNTWAPLGPGSKRGLEYIFQTHKSPNQKQAVEMMRSLRKDLVMNTDFGRTLTLHDVQNCLCEFSKYVRGYSKVKYKPYQEQGRLL